MTTTDNVTEAASGDVDDEQILVSKAEYEWLIWYAAEADFGPAGGDVEMMMRETYEEETGNKVPEAWRME